jgi:hypothetical protein
MEFSEFWKHFGIAQVAILQAFLTRWDSALLLYRFHWPKRADEVA